MNDSQKSVMEQEFWLSLGSSTFPSALDLLDFNDGLCCTQLKWVGHWYLCGLNQINHYKKIIFSFWIALAGSGGAASVADKCRRWRKQLLESQNLGGESPS